SLQNLQPLQNQKKPSTKPNPQNQHHQPKHQHLNTIQTQQNQHQKLHFSTNQNNKHQQFNNKKQITYKIFL
ncbi:hypothetical protein DF186_14790, partial [Enterococcus hirae]